MKRQLALVVALTALVGCKNDKPAQPERPLAEAIVGEWEVLCRTDAESKSTCLGKENDGLFKLFHEDGSLTAGSTKGTSMNGQWLLVKERLAIEFTGGGMKLSEEYRARMDKGRLILWNTKLGFGVIHGRKGAEFKAAPSPVTSGVPVSGELGGIGYSLSLPAGYRLTRDDNSRQIWGPTAGVGFTLRLSVTPRAQTQQSGVWVTPACNDYDYGGVLGSSATIDGVERETSIGTSLCIDTTNLVMMCSAEHTRGYLEAAEKEAALALCKALKLRR